MSIRPCREDDLESLEWDGEFAHDRSLIHATFARMQRGSILMLVADRAGEIAGQIWVDTPRTRIAHIWALRVKAAWRGRGVARQLLEAAEHESAARGFESVELEVEPMNEVAYRLYLRCGYELVHSELVWDQLTGRALGPRFLGLRKMLELARAAG
jgi:ribosomal protein S18 acetylase RimI-like enzyme